MNSINRFLSCDWGTTAFRLRLVSTEDFSIVNEVSSKCGIAAAYDDWCKTRKAEQERVNHYQSIIKDHLVQLEEKSHASLQGTPLIISGMASSNIGMMELPYKQIPFALDGSDLKTEILPASDSFPYPTLLISGVSTDDDVMRGEEVQVVGCGPEPGQKEQWIIHPGTHCKHILIEGSNATSFRTYMTGEFFSLLTTKSILAGSVSNGGNFDECKAHFEAGVKDAAKHDLLHAAFLVRTGSLFRKRSKEENYYYLSGLLIGSELKAFPKDFKGTIILAGEPALVVQYEAAMQMCGIADRAESIIIKEPDAITLAGQYAVYLLQKTP